MKRDFTQDSFEDYLKQNADSLRMKAPDRVWKNLSKELGKRRRRFALVLSTLLVVGSALGYALTGQWADEPAGRQTPPPQPTPLQPPAAPQSTQPLQQTPAGDPLTTQVRIVPLPQAFRPSLVADNNATGGGKLVDFAESLNRLRAEAEKPAESKTAATVVPFSPTVADSYNEFDKTDASQQPLASLAPSADALPLSVESVINSFRNRPKRRLAWQLYATPTVSYRKLTENKSYLRMVDPSALPSNYPGLYSNINSNVTHKPDLGFELGVAAKYNLTQHLKLRAGLQFNVNRYDISAFNAGSAQATIALNTRGSRPDTISTSTPYRNIPGYKSNWLQNLSFQVSTPVGIEYHFAGNQHVQFGLATTVQPTYILGDRAYLLTNDYKSYTQVPWLIRRWNVNTALETFVTVQGAKTRWQLGPQVRYQLLSSFISKYPVKENLFDFGLKLGVSLNK